MGIFFFYFQQKTEFDILKQYIYIFYSTQLNKGLDSLPISAFFKISIGICRIHEFHFTSKEDSWLKSNHVPFRVRQWAC